MSKFPIVITSWPAIFAFTTYGALVGYMRNGRLEDVALAIFFYLVVGGILRRLVRNF